MREHFAQKAAIAGFLLLMVCTFAILRGQSLPRQYFNLVIPELDSTPFTGSEKVIPTAGITSLQLGVLKPIADEVSYGNIYTKVNGESANIIQQVRSSLDGKVVMLDLDLRKGFRLVQGTNTVEIRAVGREGKEYYASYVLKTATDNRNKWMPYKIVHPETNKYGIPPDIVILEPDGALRLQGDVSRSIRISGLVSDDGEVRRVSIMGKEVRLELPQKDNTASRSIKLIKEESTRGFAINLEVDPEIEFIPISATDDEGIVTQVQIPVISVAPSIARFSGRKYALIVGISRYENNSNGLRDLRYADADAESFRSFLEDPRGGGFLPEDIVFLKNEEATLAKMRESMDSLFARPGPEDLLVVFIASHGSPDPYDGKNLYFICHDTLVKNMAQTALPMSEFESRFKKQVHAGRRVVFVDTCHSAGISGDSLESSRGINFENNLVSMYAEKLFSQEGQAILTSSDVNEVSNESPDWGGGHGVFTWYLLQGLRGAADENADYIITAGELFDYVQKEVRYATQFRQNPRSMPGTNDDLELSLAAPKDSGKNDFVSGYLWSRLRIGAIDSPSEFFNDR